MKEALDLGRLRVAILPACKSMLLMLCFQGNGFNVQNCLKGYGLYTIPMDNLART